MSSIPELHKKMRELVKMFGGEIVADGRLNGMLADVYGEDYGEYRNAILSAQRSGIGKKMLADAATVKEWKLYVRRLQQSFAVNSHLERPISDYIVECYAYALGYIRSAKRVSLEGTMAGLTRQITDLEHRAQKAQTEVHKTISLSQTAMGKARRVRSFGIFAVLVSVLLLAYVVYYVKVENSRLPRDPSLKVEKLLEACSVGDAKYAAELLRDGVYINSRDSLGNTPMHYAVRLASEELLDTLQKFNPDESLTNNANRTPLEEAVESNSVSYVEKLLRSKSHRWIQANYGRLKKFAKSNRMQRILDEANSKIDQMKNDIKNGNVAQFDRNLAYRNGADLHHVDENGKTLLHFAAKEGGVEMLRHLVLLGLKPDVTDNQGRLPESYASSSANENFLNHYRLKNRLIFEAVKNNNKALLRELVGYGADVNSRDEYGVPLIHYAVRYNFAMFAELQKAGADIYAKDRNYETALFVAVHKNNLEEAKTLMESGLSVHDKNVNDATPMTVVKNKTSKYLLDFTYKDEFFVSAIRRHVLDSAKYYLKLDADINFVDRKTNRAAIHYAIANDDVIALKFLLSEGANMALMYNYIAPVELALAQKKPASFKFLLQNDRGAATRVFANGKTLMHEAVLMRDAETWMDIMLQYGARIDILDRDGKTPLHYAIQKNNARCVAYLVAHRANVSRVDSEGNLPLHVAARYADGYIVKVLVTAGADPFAKNAKGDEPVTVAKHFKNASAEDELDNYSLLGKAKKGLKSVSVAGAKLWKKVKSLAD
jgi:ankyrin repeat protein